MRAILVLVLLSIFVPAPVHAQAPTKVPILFDTDIGTDLDDGFALALILASPELDLRGVTTVGGNTQQRALMACRFLTMTGRRHYAVAAGANPLLKEKGKAPLGLGSGGGGIADNLFSYYYHPDVIFNRTRRPEKENAVDFLYARLKGQPGKIAIVATGPLTNVARLITEKPECRSWIQRIVLTEGTPDPSVKDRVSNLSADIKAAQVVFASGIPMWVIPQSATARLKLDPGRCERIFKPATALSLQIQAMYQMWDRDNPVLADPVAIAVCLHDKIVKWEEKSVAIDDAGKLVNGQGKANVRIAADLGDSFLTWFTDRLASCVAPADNPAKLVPQGNMPHRVHVAEDYDNNIERHWWMSGKAELKNLPPGSNRACRAVLTHDFDDLLGNPKAMDNAVIFNPVPGPPMGKNTRLSFKYWLKGTDTMRVQIYSLTNGYHRHLVLKGLPQGRWEAGTVDMTAARRPDGTGGPLAENERIDDIQFYVDPRAELIIDDVVLYDAAAPTEKRPFPKRILFSALFDSGKQGQHWPGDFTIVPDKGYFWHAAQSVPNSELGVPWIRVHVRGQRELGAATEVSFRYQLTGADSLKVALVDPLAKSRHVVELKNLRKNEWAEATANFNLGKGGPRAGDKMEEVQFLLPKGTELLLDDMQLYEPGK